VNYLVIKRRIELQSYKHNHFLSCFLQSCLNFGASIFTKIRTVLSQKRVSFIILAGGELRAKVEVTPNSIAIQFVNAWWRAKWWRKRIAVKF